MSMKSMLSGSEGLGGWEAGPSSPPPLTAPRSLL